MTILNTNLVFGKNSSYVLHYLAQCAMAGKISKKIGGSNVFQYKPVSSEDLAKAVEAALSKTEEVKGKKFSVNGTQSATLNQLLKLSEKSVGKAEGSTSLSGSIGISMLLEEFFTGITHDRNMGLMAELMDTVKPNLEEGCPDFHTTLGLTQTENLNEYYAKTQFKANDLVQPIFTNYKMVSLD